MTARRKIALLVLGATLPLIAYAAGMPSRPKFLDITLYGASAQKMVVNSTSANGPYITFQRSGTSKSDIGNGIQCGSSFTADSLCMAARTGGVVEMAANGSSTPQVRIETAGYLHTVAPASEQLRLGGVTGANNPFMSWYGTNGTTRFGYFQALSATGEIQLGNETSAAPINFVTTGGGQVQANGLPIGTMVVGSYTGTLTGCTTAPTGTVNYSIASDGSQKVVTFRFLSFGTCTSNSTSFTITGGPVAMRPSSASTCTPIYSVTNNSVVEFGTAVAIIQGSGTINIDRNGSGGGWTNAGTKGFQTTAVMVCWYI